jgi:tetratricopeptide (TPR) repeat protein
MGNKLLELGYPEQALGLFNEATHDPETPSREKILSHVKAGGILALLGKREEATAHYEQVERLQDFEDAHKAAREFLDKASHR